MRTEPLLEDRGDVVEFENYVLGYPEFGQYKPFFFDKHRNPLHLEGSYGNESLFIVCGGPSLNSMDFELLKKPGVILLTVNNSVVSLLNRHITPAFSLFCDSPDSFITEMLFNPAIQKFTPFNNHGKPLWNNKEWKPLDKRLKDCNNVAYFFRNEKFMPERWFCERTINWGSHKTKGEDMRSTLLAAIKIAFVLGFRHVYLLGVDFCIDKENPYAFNESRNSHLIKTNNRNYKLMAEKYLPQIKEQGKKLNFNVYNCNKVSNLNVFGYVTLAEAVKNATKKCSPTDVIETRGLYNTKYNDKLKITREQAGNK